MEGNFLSTGEQVVYQPAIDPPQNWNQTLNWTLVAKRVHHHSVLLSRPTMRIGNFLNLIGTGH
eukprot:13020357-Ditylum_brightwellii.AAC.1